MTNPYRLRRPRRRVRTVPGPRLVGRLYGAAEDIDRWLARLEAMPGDRRAFLEERIPLELATVLRRARRAIARETADDWFTSWRRGQRVSNSDAVIALLKARQALGWVAELYDTRFAMERQAAA